MNNPIRIATELQIPPDAKSLDGLHKFADGLARHLQDTTGAAPLMWLVSDNTDTVYLIEAKWQSDREQMLALDIMRGMMQALPEVCRYAFIYEAWMARQATAPELSDPDFVFPRDRPDREETLGIDTYERGGGHLKTIYIVTRDPVARSISRTKLEAELHPVVDNMDLFARAGFDA